MTSEPNDQGHYANRLVRVNDDRAVLANEDIYSENGALLVKKGARIDAPTAHKIVRHKLTAPIERSVSIEDAVDKAAVLSHLETFKDRFADVEALHQATGASEAFTTAANRMELHPLVFQKLTVMSLEDPDVYDQSVFRAWMATLLTRELGKSPSDEFDACVAALTCDLGFLHLNSEILRRPPHELLSQDDWASLRTHPVVSSMFIQEVAGLTPPIVRAVREHHERFDGSGYPTAASGAQLGRLGQIVGLADTITQSRLRHFASSVRGLLDTKAVLRVSATLFNPTLVAGAVALLERLESKEDGPPLSLDGAPSPAVLREKCIRLRDAYAHLARLCEGVSPEQALVLSRLSARGRMLTRRCGLFEDVLLEWLDAVASGTDSATYHELCDLDVAIRELSFFLRRSALELRPHTSGEPLETSWNLFISSLDGVLSKPEERAAA